MKLVNKEAANEFLAEAEEILEGVADELIGLEQSAAEGDPDPDVINAIFRGAHSLKGLAGMFGFEEITEVSHKLESLLDELRMGKIQCERPVMDVLFDGIDTIKGLCAHIATGHTGHENSHRNFLTKLEAITQGGPEAEPEPEGIESLKLGEDTLKILTDYEIHRIEENLKNPKKTLAVVSVGIPLETIDTDMEKVNAEIKPLGEIISTLPSMGEMAEDRLDFDLIVGFKAPLSEASEKLAPYGATVESLPRTNDQGPQTEPPPIPEAPPLPEAMPPSEVDKALAEALSAAEAAVPEQLVVETVTQPLPPTTYDSKPIPPAPAAAKAVGELRSLTKTVRVELPKLDQLMNMVGELVLTKGRLMALNERLSSRMGFTGEALELAKAQKELERRLALMQEAVMDVRMVPMGQLFSKLHRVIRKIIQSTGKQIDLQIIGAETQLDKLIVEDISDPLIHVIRNAVDHGIEDTDVREVKGKPREGQVGVSAQQRGNYVVVEVSDDGAGIDPKKVREKAIKKGLISENDHLDRKQLFDLLFLPGFSTRDNVTELSGRGVGMDVLRKNIANLSGIIEMDSEVGRGTTVKIILPITLAIIQALLVESGAEVYAIPLSSVLETVVIDPDCVRSLEGRPVLKLREQTLPLVRLSTLFEQDVEGGEEPIYAVIVGIAEKRVAFAVNDLVSQRDVVIKTLGKHLKSLKGICGATDLGDQRTVLILDIAELIEEVFQVV